MMWRGGGVELVYSCTDHVMNTLQLKQYICIADESRKWIASHSYITICPEKNDKVNEIK